MFRQDKQLLFHWWYFRYASCLPVRSIHLRQIIWTSCLSDSSHTPKERHFGEDGLKNRDGLVWFIVLNITLNNFSVISWRSVLLVEEIGVLGVNHRSAASHWQTVSHNVVSSTHRHTRGFELTTLVVIGTDSTSSYKTTYIRTKSSFSLLGCTLPSNRYITFIFLLKVVRHFASCKMAFNLSSRLLYFISSCQLNVRYYITLYYWSV